VASEVDAGYGGAAGSLTWIASLGESVEKVLAAGFAADSCTPMIDMDSGVDTGAGAARTSGVDAGSSAACCCCITPELEQTTSCIRRINHRSINC
jgi:hypothetical protein